MYEQKPWLKFYQHVPHTIDYPRVTMYEALELTARAKPDDIAYDFMGYTSTYRQFMAEIDQCADALASLGLQKGERITISMPTSPQGIICFYAANKLGAGKFGDNLALADFFIFHQADEVRVVLDFFNHLATVLKKVEDKQEQDGQQEP